MRGSLLFLASFGAALSFGADGPKPQAGWFGVFPRKLVNYDLRYLPPVVAEGKEPTAYRQEVQYDWLGNDFRQAKAVLARDPEFKTTHTPEALKQRGAIEVVVGKRSGWLLPPRGGTDAEKQRDLIVPLAEDKALIVTGVGHFGDQEAIGLADMFDSAKAVDALAKPPRTDFRRDKETFRALPKGASGWDVLDWTGYPDKSDVKDKEVAGSDYHLADGGSVHITYEEGKLTGATYTGKDGKTEELLK